MVEAQSPVAGPTGDLRTGRRDYRHYVAILVISLAALLLEVSYTRVVSFKFFYYWTYLVIGLALLGIGCGAVLVALSERVRRASTDRILLWSFLLGSAAVGAGYVVVARTPVNTLVIWEYKAAALSNLGWLLLVSVAMFAAFVPAGLALSTLFGRRPEDIGRLYFFDLLGAGVACGVVVLLVSHIGPPATIFLGGLLMAVLGAYFAVRLRSRLVVLGLVLVGLLGAYTVHPSGLPNISTDADHIDVTVSKPMYSAWNAVFRIDVVNYGKARLVFHDGVLGSEMLQWDGTQSSLSKFDFPHDPRALPFDALGLPPRNVTIIGAAGGHEVLASLFYHSGHIDAVELNPTTYQLVTKTFAGYVGHLAQNPKVSYIFGDGRSYLARTTQKSDLVWYPAPDSYSATNAATASAFVLSESYLYTTQAVVSSLQHLTPGGMLAAQFGEYSYDTLPLRTARYVETARAALKQLGVTDPGAHILVATAPRTGAVAGLSTIIVSMKPFSVNEVKRFASGILTEHGGELRWAPGYRVDKSPVTMAASASDAQLARFNHAFESHYSVTPVTDQQPFFWHFATFTNVIDNFGKALTGNQEVATGERVLLLLLVVAIVLAAVFLLLPFLAVRREWARLPRKGTTGVYFSAIGLGFIFFEITMIQRLILFLGYPTYSLTVTLCSLLVFLGIGALLSERRPVRSPAAPWVLLAVVVGLTLYYLFGLGATTDALIRLPLAAKAPIAFGLMAPLGICLGMFMPLGIGAVASLGSHQREYVAWAWAVNGFATVVGSVLATIVAMTYGFGSVLVLALVLYLLAVVSLRSVTKAGKRLAAADAAGSVDDLVDLGTGAPAEPVGSLRS